MNTPPELYLAYELGHSNEASAYVTRGARVVCLDFWVECELRKRDIPCISMQDFIDTEKDEEKWWVLAQNLAREWYRLPIMGFFEHKGIRIAEALEPLFEAYLSRLFYYVRVHTALKRTYPNAHMFIPAPTADDGPTGGPLISFERWIVIDAAYVAQLPATVLGERIRQHSQPFPRTATQSFLIRVYNTIISCIPHRSLKIYVSEYWSHIAPILAHIHTSEIVLMESGELKNIPWRKILKHRIRVRHPADITNASAKYVATQHTREFMNQWTRAQKDVLQYLSTLHRELNWTPVLNVCEHLITYSSRIIADIDGFYRIMEEEKPNEVLQMASIGGRRHHFFLMAHIAAQLQIPSVELQHAGAIFDPRSVHSHIETAFIASYGEVEREQHMRNGYAPERIVPVGSPRFDKYRQDISNVPYMRGEILSSIGLTPTRPVVLVAVPPEQVGLSPVSFSSYNAATLFQELQKIRHLLPDIQFLFKFRYKNCTASHQTYIQRLFPEGGIAITDGDPCQFIYASDYVISGNSTITYESMISERPLILYPWKSWDYNLHIYNTTAPYARSSTELAHILKMLCSNEAYRREVLEKQRQFIERHLFDGHASERVATLLRKIASKSTGT